MMNVKRSNVVFGKRKWQNGNCSQVPELRFTRLKQPPRNREVEVAKARARIAKRFG